MSQGARKKERSNEIVSHVNRASLQLTLINAYFIFLVSSLSHCVSALCCAVLCGVQCVSVPLPCIVIIVVFLLLHPFIIIFCAFMSFSAILYVHKMQISYYKLLTSNENAVRAALYSFFFFGFVVDGGGDALMALQIL